MIRRRHWRPTPVLLPGKSHGQRSLVGCGPWGREESDTIERLPFRFSLSCVGEGNINLLQCSCLENPRDGGAWWAAVYGVTQSRTRLKWLSSSSSRSLWHHNFNPWTFKIINVCCCHYEAIGCFCEMSGVKKLGWWWYIFVLHLFQYWIAFKEDTFFFW